MGVPGGAGKIMTGECEKMNQGWGQWSQKVETPRETEAEDQPMQSKGAGQSMLQAFLSAFTVLLCFRISML